MMTPAEIDMYAREVQRDRRNEAAMEAQARHLAPGPFDRLLAALRPRPAAKSQAARPVTTVAAPVASR
jgi:hypothetical protein